MVFSIEAVSAGVMVAAWLTVSLFCSAAAGATEDSVSSAGWSTVIEALGISRSL